MNDQQERKTTAAGRWRTIAQAGTSFMFVDDRTPDGMAHVLHTRHYAGLQRIENALRFGNGAWGDPVTEPTTEQVALLPTPGAGDTASGPPS